MSEKILFLPAIYAVLTDLKPHLIAFFFRFLVWWCGFLVFGIVSCIIIVLKVKVFIWDPINDRCRKVCQGPASFPAYEK